MTATTGFLSTLVGIMVFFTAISPFILLIMLFKDWNKGTLW
ncbi:MAG: hypothetical protein P8076_11745 [Gammaproteobacteria bacterium]|jgi:hypothetical protein